MITISLCMIVKNEASVLARCLACAQAFADEIIIVDTGSTDETKAIAQTFTDKIYDFQWIDDFSAARNFAFSKATGDYQMWLDADDILPDASIDAINNLKINLCPQTDLITMKYITHFDHNGTPLFTSTRERLFKCSKNFQWEDPIHEVIPMTGQVLHTDIAIHHAKTDQGKARSHDRNLNIYLNLEAKGHLFSPRQLYYFARELRDHNQTAKAIYYFERFLATKKGWKEDNIAACFTLASLYEQLNASDKILPILLKSFTWDSPRPEICSHIGYYYKKTRDFATALKWFQLAAILPQDPHFLGFLMPDYLGYIPHIEASVCAYELGNLPLAIEHNKLAMAHKNTEATQLNQAFFNSRLAESPAQ